MRDYEKLIRELVRRGDESPKVDFKATLDLDDREVVVDLARTILAVANTDSDELDDLGLIIVGAKKGVLLGGVEQFARDNVCASVLDKVAPYIDPLPRVEVKGFRDPDVGQIAVVVVFPSPRDQRPHFVKKEYQNDQKKKDKVVLRRHECYVRRGEQVALAAPADFERMYRARFGRVYEPGPRLRWLVDGRPIDVLRIPPRRDVHPEDPGPDDPFPVSELEACTTTFRERAQHYNDALRSFFDAWSRYDDSMVIHRIVEANGNFLSLSLANDGEAALKSPTVRVSFPEVFAVADADELPEQPERPRRPSRPTPPTTGLAVFFEGSGLAKFFEAAQVAPGLRLPLRPELPRFISNSLEIDSKRGIVSGGALELLHGVDPLDFETVVLLVPKDAGPGEYQVSYSVHAENLPQPFRGSLTLVVEEGVALVGQPSPEEDQDPDDAGDRADSLE